MAKQMDWHTKMTRALRVATDTARKAGKILVEELAGLKPEEIDEKGVNDYVTKVDRKSEDFIRAAIAKEFPGDDVIGEESGGPDGSVESLWVVDPLDGTHNYVHRLPHFSVSIAMMFNGRVEIGVIFDPIRNEMFACKRDEGVWLNDTPISVSSCGDMGRALVGTGLPARYRRDSGPFVAQLGRVIPVVASIRRSGSAALDLAYVACGRLDGFWETILSPWDMAAGGLLVETAGGVISDPSGNPWNLKSVGIVAGNPATHPALLKLLAG